MWVAADKSVSKKVGKESPKSKGEKKDITGLKYKALMEAASTGLLIKAVL